MFLFASFAIHIFFNLTHINKNVLKKKTSLYRVFNLQKHYRGIFNFYYKIRIVSIQKYIFLHHAEI